MLVNAGASLPSPHPNPLPGNHTAFCSPFLQANEAFKSLPVRMSCGALESSSAEVKAYEAADAARAEAEKEFLFDADQLDK